MRKKQIMTTAIDGRITAFAGFVSSSWQSVASRGHVSSVVRARNSSATPTSFSWRTPPLVAYGGGIKGHAATRPGKGEKIDPTNPKVANYKSLPRVAAERGACQRQWRQENL